MADQGIQEERVAAWFQGNIAGCVLPLKFTRVAGGQSNLTFRVEDASHRSFALRRPPLGNIPPNTHDVAREYRIQDALRNSEVPVAGMLGVCTDKNVNAADFYVMDWVEGDIIDNASTATAQLPTSVARQTASHHLIDSLAALHRVDYVSVGLGELSRHEDFLGRSLKRMREVWERTKTEDNPSIDLVHKTLLRRKPPQTHTGIIHCDYRFGNVMLNAERRVIAILDWELCTIGDVLSDLAFLLNNWDLPGDPWPDVWTEIAPTRAGDFPDREHLLSRYVGATGFNVAHINYYRAFNYWRIAIIAEGVRRRYQTGAMSDQHYDRSALAARVRDRAELARFFLEQPG